MFRTHTNGELTLANLNEKVTLSGWVQTIRDKGFMIWVDLRDRYGITQLVLDEERSSKELLESAKKLGREFVIQVKGSVIERASKNPKIPTGDIEILVSDLKILNASWKNNQIRWIIEKPQLKAIFENIVKKYAMSYCA